MRAFRLPGKAMWFCTVAALGGCAGEAAGPAPGDPSPPAVEELNEQSLRIVGAGGLQVKDSPALMAGAEGSLMCGARYALDGRERLTCTRGREKLEVILHAAEKRAVVLHRPTGGANDQRTFFVCTSSGNGPGDLPSSLKCTKKAPSVSGGGGGLASPFAS
ncbi:MAG: hypothetical protein KF819_38850, partial [Labilithrix sp.]|nr:hypothetical protein [Labilithrix sp.]